NFCVGCCVEHGAGTCRLREEGSASGPCAATAATGRSGAAAAPASTAAAGARATAAADRGADFRPEIARSAERGEAARRRLLRPGRLDDSRRRQAATSEERGLDEAVDEHAGDRRGPLRLARQLG